MRQRRSRVREGVTTGSVRSGRQTLKGTRSPFNAMVKQSITLQNFGKLLDSASKNLPYEINDQLYPEELCPSGRH